MFVKIPVDSLTLKHEKSGLKLPRFFVTDLILRYPWLTDKNYFVKNFPTQVLISKMSVSVSYQAPTIEN